MDNISLQICKKLHAWFQLSHDNSLQLQWHPSHTGLFINEKADILAGSSFPSIPPRPMATLASHRKMFQNLAVQDWQAQSLTALQQWHIELKFKWSVAMPQLWGKKGRQFYHLINNNISLMSWFVRITSGHAPIGSFRQWFFPDSNSECPCGSGLQNTEHISVLCPKYSAKFTSFVQFLFSSNNTK